MEKLFWPSLFFQTVLDPNQLHHEEKNITKRSKIVQIFTISTPYHVTESNTHASTWCSYDDHGGFVKNLPEIEKHKIEQIIIKKILI